MNKKANGANNKAFLALIAALAIGGTATLKAQTILTATSNSGIDSYYSSENFQPYSAFGVGSNDAGVEIGRVFVQFDISSIPSNATITSATLEVGGTANNLTTATISGYAVTQSWTDTGVTWTTTNGSTPWTTAGGAYESTPSFSLTSTFNSPLNQPPYNVPPYTNPATYSAVYTDFTGAGLTSDVQNWVNGSLADDGWVLINSNEQTGSAITQLITNSANTQPNAGSGPWGPLLEVAYTVPEPKEAILFGFGAVLLVISMARRKRAKI